MFSVNTPHQCNETSSIYVNMQFPFLLLAALKTVLLVSLSLHLHRHPVLSVEGIGFDKSFWFYGKVIKNKGKRYK